MTELRTRSPQRSHPRHAAVLFHHLVEPAQLRSHALIPARGAAPCQRMVRHDLTHSGLGFHPLRRHLLSPPPPSAPAHLFARAASKRHVCHACWLTSHWSGRAISPPTASANGCGKHKIAPTHQPRQKLGGASRRILAISAADLRCALVNWRQAGLPPRLHRHRHRLAVIGIARRHVRIRPEAPRVGIKDAAARSSPAMAACSTAPTPSSLAPFLPRRYPAHCQLGDWMSQLAQHKPINHVRQKNQPIPRPRPTPRPSILGATGSISRR